MNNETGAALPLTDTDKKKSFLALVLSVIVKRRALLIEFAMTFVLFFGRYLYYGWTYFTQLDDYIQLHNYASYYSLNSSSMWDFISSLGALAQRPLAGLADIFVWSRMFSSLIIAVLIMSLMYAASALLLRFVFNKLFGTGYFFTLVFCLLPMTTEGLYWVSASSRIVPALFFAALATFFIYKFTLGGRLPYMFLFAVSQLLCFAYYEQIAVLSIVLAAAVAVMAHNKRSLAALFVFANSLIYVVYSKIAGSIWQGGVYGTRGKLAIPFLTDGYWSRVFEPAKDQVLEAAGGFMPRASMRALVRGIRIIARDRAYVYVIALVLVCALLCFLLLRAKRDEVPGVKKALIPLGFGVVLALSPLAPFFILENNWLSMRAIVPCLCGVALVFDTLFRLICRGKRFVTVPLITLFALAACIASVSEMHDYRAVTEFDRDSAQTVIDAVGASLDGADINQDTNIAVLNMSTDALPEQNYQFHEHVNPACASCWSFTGLLRCRSGDGAFPAVTAMPADAYGYYYYSWHGDSFRLENYDYIFVAEGGSLTLVTPMPEDSRSDCLTYTLLTGDGESLARVCEYADHGIFELY